MKPPTKGSIVETADGKFAVHMCHHCIGTFETRSQAELVQFAAVSIHEETGRLISVWPVGRKPRRLRKPTGTEIVMGELWRNKRAEKSHRFDFEDA